MAEGEVTLNPGYDGAEVRTQVVLENGKQVHQQVVTLADAEGNLIGSGGSSSATNPDLEVTVYRLENGMVPDSMEMRYCLQESTYYDPATGTSYSGVDGGEAHNTAYLSIYMGYAPVGSALTDTVWNVLRIQTDSGGNPVRKAVETGVAWLTDSVTAGVINGGALWGAW